MNFILMTQTGGFLGPIAKLLGWIMNAIFNVIDLIGLPNVGLAIILFTVVVNVLMLPLTIKQQKFSKLSAKMNPEIQAIQAKYKNKKDNDSMMAQNQEVQAVYAKYGVSPSGSCVQLLIQMPILFALYRVIYAMPAYVTKIGDTFRVLSEKIISVDKAEFLKNPVGIAEESAKSIQSVVSMYGKNIDQVVNVNGVSETVVNANGITDVLNKLSSTDLGIIAEHYGLNELTYNGDLILGADGLINTFNNFLGLNIGDSPMTLIKEGIAIGAWGIVIGAILIPVLSALTQWLNTKLMPQPQQNNDQAGSVGGTMKTMNKIMPLMSAWFCFSLPAGMGLYWVAGAVVRSVIQVVINKRMDNIDFDELIKKNSKKSAKKMEKLQQRQEVMNAYANMKTKNIQSPTSTANSQTNGSSTETKTPANVKPGSMMAKAMMVKDYNEKNN